MNRKLVAGTLAAVLMAVVVAALWWRQLDARDPIVGGRRWSERAAPALTGMFRDPASAAALAPTIVEEMHPLGGGSGEVESVEVSSAGNRLTARIVIRWSGRYLGGRYATTLDWTVNPHRHVSLRVVAQNSPTDADEDRVGRFFRTRLYPDLLSRIAP